MDFPLVPVLVAAAAVAALGLLMRRGTTPEQTGLPPSAGTVPEPRYADDTTPAGGAAGDELSEMLDDDEFEPDDDAMLAVTSHGQVFMPAGADVRILPLEGSHAAIASGQIRWEDVKAAVLEAARKGGGGMPGIQLDVGDFSAGRVVRGAPDIDPWRLELLGRDGEYQDHPFETQEAANAALGMLTRLEIVQRPVDEDGEPIAVSGEQFDEARRAYDETLEELANMPDVETRDERARGDERDPSAPR